MTMHQCTSARWRRTISFTLMLYPQRTKKEKKKGLKYRYPRRTQRVYHNDLFLKIIAFLTVILPAVNGTYYPGRVPELEKKKREKGEGKGERGRKRGERKEKRKRGED